MRSTHYIVLQDEDVLSNFPSPNKLKVYVCLHIFNLIANSQSVIACRLLSINIIPAFRYISSPSCNSPGYILSLAGASVSRHKAMYVCEFTKRLRNIWTFFVLNSKSRQKSTILLFVLSWKKLGFYFINQCISLFLFTFLASTSKNNEPTYMYASLIHLLMHLFIYHSIVFEPKNESLAFYFPSKVLCK